MKAVIVELNNGYAAALTDDGCIKKIVNKDYAIGQVIELKTRNARKLAVWAASAAAAVVLCTVSVWAYASPYAYVSLDVNPSIEYSVNRFNRVLSARAVNEDGSEILNGLALNNKSIEDAVRETVRKIAQAGYFSGEEPGGVVVAAASGDEQAAEELADEIKDAVDITAQETGADVEVECESVGLERVLQAKELGVTPGKLNLVEKLKASAEDPDSIDINEWLHKPVKDIMKATKENRKSAKSSNSPVPGDSGSLSSGSSGDTAGLTGTESSAEQKKDAASSKAPAKENGKKGVSSAVSSGKANANSNAGRKDISSAVTSGKVNGNSGENGNAGKDSDNTGKDNGNAGKGNANAADNASNGKGSDNSGKKDK